mmetsp:Transcript_30002/g.81954  ORF Transcript_30002/g.81954 Transcript_30002/m.81954 type:complete len:245 (-) Transcript_30002:361-1095(-)
MLCSAARIDEYHNWTRLLQCREHVFQRVGPAADDEQHHRGSGQRVALIVVAKGGGAYASLEFSAQIDLAAKGALALLAVVNEDEVRVVGVDGHAAILRTRRLEVSHAAIVVHATIILPAQVLLLGDHTPRSDADTRHLDRRLLQHSPHHLHHACIGATCHDPRVRDLCSGEKASAEDQLLFIRHLQRTRPARDRYESGGRGQLPNRVFANHQLAQRLCRGHAECLLEDALIVRLLAGGHADEAA